MLTPFWLQSNVFIMSSRTLMKSLGKMVSPWRSVFRHGASQHVHAHLHRGRPVQLPKDIHISLVNVTAMKRVKHSPVFNTMKCFFVIYESVTQRPVAFFALLHQLLDCLNVVQGWVSTSEAGLFYGLVFFSFFDFRHICNKVTDLVWKYVITLNTLTLPSANMSLPYNVRHYPRHEFSW